MKKIKDLNRRNLLCGMASLPALSLLWGCGEADENMAQTGKPGTTEPEVDRVEELLSGQPAADIHAQAAQLGITGPEIDRAEELLSLHPAADVHAHPGRFFLEGITSWDPSVDGFLAQGTYPAKTIGDMSAAGLAVACFSIVGDMKSLTFSRSGITATRAFEEGEVWAEYLRQIKAFNGIMDRFPLHLVRTPGDVSRRKNGQVGAILTAEGSDFLEGNIDRLQRVYDDGVRAMTIVHYRISEVGDIQTAAPVYGGLSPFGGELVRGMNDLGMIVDLAHASFETTKQAVAITTKPVMLSHSHILHEDSPNARLISAEHARLIADTGGVIGAWPAGITQHGLADYIDEILRLIDVVGIDHVSLGTDMDVNFKPVFDNYRQLPLVTALLLKKGLSEAEVAKIIGGNFIRIFQDVTAR